MNTVKIKEICKVMGVSIVALGLFAALLLGFSHLTLRAATSETTSLPPAMLYASIPSDPVQLAAEQGPQSRNMTVVDLTGTGLNRLVPGDDITVDPLALTPEEAAAIGAQYIYDIFGVCIDGMYVEVEFAPAWALVGRMVWHGEVSLQYRGTRAHRIEEQRLMDEFMAARNRGEDTSDMRWGINSRIPEPPMFRFIIDAITGERMDVFHVTNITAPRMIEEHEFGIIPAYIEREWRGNWDAALSAEVTSQTLEELYQLAWHYGQRQFLNTTVNYVEFIGAFRGLSLDDNSNVVHTAGQANFEVTDEAGRVAILIFCLETMGITSISTFRNEISFHDVVPGGTPRDESYGTWGQRYFPQAVE